MVDIKLKMVFFPVVGYLLPPSLPRLPLIVLSITKNKCKIMQEKQLISSILIL